ncbi:MAG: hypothetical protein VKN17_00420, partial [Cyanobacteriota bacterium]|nr:hypothetical protein [Cyanobacteriota bacterium]
INASNATTTGQLLELRCIERQGHTGANGGLWPGDCPCAGARSGPCLDPPDQLRYKGDQQG